LCIRNNFISDCNNEIIIICINRIV